MKDVLEELKSDTSLLRNLLRSFKRRLDLVRAAGGKNIGKYLRYVLVLTRGKKTVIYFGPPFICIWLGTYLQIPMGF